LKYPPFTFEVDKFQAGELEAIGFIDGRKVASHQVRTSLKPNRLRLTAALDGKAPPAGKKDVFFVYASIVDENGTLVPTASNPVTLELSGPARLIGQNPMKAEAGIASIVVETPGKGGLIEIGASSPGLLAAEKNYIKVE
jgi:beta-galactosidase